MGQLSLYYRGSDHHGMPNINVDWTHFRVLVHPCTSFWPHMKGTFQRNVKFTLSRDTLCHPNHSEICKYRRQEILREVFLRFVTRAAHECHGQRPLLTTTALFHSNEDEKDAEDALASNMHLPRREDPGIKKEQRTLDCCGGEPALSTA